MKTRNITASRSPLRKIPFGRIVRALLKVLACCALAGGLCWWGRGVFFLQKRAQAGDLEAQYRFGQRCFNLASSREEFFSGLEWMLKAAEGGHAKAQMALGIAYARGIKLSQSTERAQLWLTRAAMQGEPLAQNELATMYAKGRGVPRDLKKAVHWYSQAASSGAQAAERNLFLIEAARSKTIGDIATRRGKCYPQASLRKIESDGITVTFKADGGMGFAKLKVEDLPERLAALCRQDNGRGHAESAFKWSQLDLAAIQM